MPKSNGSQAKTLLLDTHVWLWLINDSDQLKGARIVGHIEEYAQHNGLRVSAISVWEIGMLVAKKKITLSKDVFLWVKESLKENGLTVEPLSNEILLESNLLDVHGDPADRMIIATAKLTHAAIMTADKAIIQFCRKHDMEVVPVS